MTNQQESIVLDLDKGKQAIITEVFEILKRYSVYLKEGDMSLSFILRRSGEKDREFVYNFTQEEYENAEQDVVFPRVVEEILKKEFPPNIARNPKVVQHVMGELKKDPYWSEHVVKLLDAIELHSH